jgi:beta-galactosidase/beta-glucuronidase
MDSPRKKARVGVSTESYEWGIHPWSMQTPNLYDLVVKIYADGVLVDEVGSYFGMRKIEIHGSNIMLNNSPIYQRLVLDQGYWPDSGLTPPSEEALILDIDRLLALGFNGLRKHQKIEDERFLYWCDVKGVLVWSEMAATYQFDPEATEQLTREWLEIVKQNYNHPCIITWVPFNESWGVAQIKSNKPQQSFTQAIYHLTKALDCTRPVITNDGWEHTCSDIITLHDYQQDATALESMYRRKELLENNLTMSNGKFAFADGWQYQGQPVIISEYGGTAIDGKGEGWGYGTLVKDEKQLAERYGALTDTIKRLDYVCGYCYTQLTDVEQEVNGLLDVNRNPKCDLEIICDLNKK